MTRLWFLPLLASVGCDHLRHPGETGFRDSFGRDTVNRDSRRGDTGVQGVGDDYFPLGTGWSWTYNATDGGVEHRGTIGAASFNGVDCWAVNEWNSSDSEDAYDESTVYFLDDASGVSVLGTQHADGAEPTAVDTLTYDPPMFYVPADPATTPAFSTIGTAHLTVTAADGTLTQDTTIDWTLSGSVVAATIDTTAGNFEGYRITYTPGGSLAVSEGVGLVDLGSNRLLTSYERGK
jgi:hypothetical protein